jgi:hypothetical protein
LILGAVWGLLVWFWNFLVWLWRAVATRAAMKRLFLAGVVGAFAIIGLRSYDDVVAYYCMGHHTAPTCEARAREAKALQEACHSEVVLAALHQALARSYVVREHSILALGPLMERGHAVMVTCGAYMDTPEATMLVYYSIAPKGRIEYGTLTSDRQYYVNIESTSLR